MYRPQERAPTTIYAKIHTQRSPNTPRPLQPVDSLHFLLIQRPREDIHIVLQMGFGTGFGYRDDLSLYQPPQSDLGGGFVVVAADPGQRGVVRYSAHSQRTVRRDDNPVVAAVAPDGFLEMTDMELNLIVTYRRLSQLYGPIHLFVGKIAHADMAGPVRCLNLVKGSERFL